MTPVSVFQVSNFLSYSHYKIKGPYEKKNWFRPGRHRHMNSQIMENVIQYYLHVYDSALRIYSQNKSEYRTANYLYCGAVKREKGARNQKVRALSAGGRTNTANNQGKIDTFIFS